MKGLVVGVTEIVGITRLARVRQCLQQNCCALILAGPSQDISSP
jgi:hypothetical protein